MPLLSTEALELTDVPFASVDNKSFLFFHVWAEFIGALYSPNCEPIVFSYKDSNAWQMVFPLWARREKETLCLFFFL